MQRIFLVVIVVMTLSTAGFAQIYSITMSEITSCSGIVEDSGGASDSYLNNENLGTLICPADSGLLVSLQFLVFDLSLFGNAPYDRLIIRDGPNLTSPMIGEFTGTELLGMTVSASSSNSSGCLRVSFLSNEAGTGNFAFAVSCNQNCGSMGAQLNIEGGATAGVCAGNTIQLDAGGSYVTPEHTIDHYLWIIQDTSITTTSPILDYAFNSSGLFNASVQVVDDAGCVSPHSVPVSIISSPPAQIDVTAMPATVCAGGTTLLNAAAIIPQIAGPGYCRDHPTGLYLADDLGVSFQSHQVINTAPAGAVINSVSEIESICIDLEHSFMGDIVVELACPNGQSVALHQQGGGGTYVGAANDTDGIQNPIIGACWNYCWSPNAVSGTWSEAVAAGQLVLGGTPIQNALIPGTYSSVQPLSNLIGCPVNGTWIMSITDNWGADNGFMCSWCLDLSQLPDTNYIVAGPVLGTSPDSSFWSGPNVMNDPTNTGTAVVDLPDTGTFNFTYTIVDSFGCTHTSELALDVVSPVVDAGPDVELCNGPAVLQATVTGAVECVYMLVLNDSYGDGWNGGALLEVLVDGASSTYSAIGSGTTIPISTNSWQQIDLFYTAGSIFNIENSFELIGPLGEVIFESGQGPASGTIFSMTADCGFGNVWWSPTTNSTSANSLTPTVFTATSQWYYVFFQPEEGACIVSDSVWVEASNTGILDLTYDPVMLTLCVEPQDLTSYDWYLDGIFHSTSSLPCMEDIEPGSWLVIGTPDTGCVMGGDTLICPQAIITQQDGTLAVQSISGTYTWSYQGNVIPDATGSVIELIDIGLYEVSISMDNGCVLQSSYQVIMLEAPATSAEVLQFRVYPNPSSGTFNVIANSVSGLDAIIQIRDITGRSISRFNVPVSQNRIQEALHIDAAPGNYLIELSDSYGSRSKHLIIN